VRRLYFSLGRNWCRFEAKVHRWSARRASGCLPGLTSIHFSTQSAWQPMIEAGFDRKCGVRLTFGPMSSADAHGADLVVPLTVEDSLLLSGQNSKSYAGLCLSPSRQLIELAHDKRAFNARLCELGFGDFVPEMYEARVKFPYILKKSLDESSVSTKVIRSAEDESRHEAEIADPAYFRQAFVAGNTEYATHMLMYQGRLVHHMSVMYTFENQYPIKGQEGDFRRIVSTPCLDRLVEILSKLGYEGVCCFNYKVNERGHPMIIELNPRFGGSLCHHFPVFVRAMVASGLFARPRLSLQV
jgi:hypothetical protein